VLSHPEVDTSHVQMGLPDEEAFLAYLNKAHLPYDLTTDLGLIEGDGPQLDGYKGVVFAGSERWVPASLVMGTRKRSLSSCTPAVLV